MMASRRALDHPASLEKRDYPRSWTAFYLDCDGRQHTHQIHVMVIAHRGDCFPVEL